MNALMTNWLRLTGGEGNCPRGRFALTMLAAYGAYHLLLPMFMHCAITLGQQGLPGQFSAAGLLLILMSLPVLVSMLMAFLPLSPMALLGVEGTLAEAYALVQGAGSAASPVPGALWPCWLGVLLGAPILLLAGAVAFGAAWRRLKDAGRSPLFLLLGLTYVLGFSYEGSYSAEASGLYLLGPLWLIILYSQPSQAAESFAIFRTPPTPQKNEETPRAEAPAQRSAPPASARQGARPKRTGARSRVTSSRPSPGRNPGSAGTHPSPSNGAGSYRRRMRERVQAARRRS